MMRLAKAVPVVCLLLTALVSMGCGGPKGPVKITVNGTVTYKGKNLPSGIVTFHGPNGYYGAAVLQSDGKFTMTDVMPGEIKVGVMESPQGSGDSSGAAPSKKAAAPVDLPQKFRDPATSGLVYTITPDTKELTIAIQ